MVDGRTHALAHTGVEAIAAMGDVGALGEAKPDTYSALVELASPVSTTAGEGVAALSALRARLRTTGAVAIGAGIHPDAAFGDVEHVPEARYAAIVAQLGGLIRRTPTCALHVHVGVPDAGDRDPGLQRDARAPAAAAGAGGQLAVLVRPRLGPGDRAGPAVPRLPARRDPARLRRLRGLRRVGGGGRGRRRPARLHVPVVGRAPAPEPRDDRGARDGQPVGAVVGGRPRRARAVPGPRRGARATGPGRRARRSWRRRSRAARDGLAARLPLGSGLASVADVAAARA